MIDYDQSIYRNNIDILIFGSDAAKTIERKRNT